MATDIRIPALNFLFAWNILFALNYVVSLSLNF